MSELEKTLVAEYAKRIDGLSDDAKAELFKLLSIPSTIDERTRKELFYSSFGGWNYMDKSTEEIIEEIRSAKSFRDKDLGF